MKSKMYEFLNNFIIFFLFLFNSNKQEKLRFFFPFFLGGFQDLNGTLGF